MTAPRFLDDAAYRCLRDGDLEGYHRAIEGRKLVDFSGTDLRGVDFRRADLSKIILRDAYLRDGDLRGCDLRHLDLEGTSMERAKIAGAYFPRSVSADEIRMSVECGTRIRANKA
jgi:uncharacterized protein YjbI with pentapeptide repeats